MAVGPGRLVDGGKIVPLNVSIGDKVLLPEYGGQTVHMEGEDLTLFREDEILAKFEG
jgi:chaperonin GroES